MVGHLAVGLTAAAVTAASAPLVARLARRLGALEAPPDPGGNTRARGGPGQRRTPTLGGLAMLAGLLAAMGLARILPGFEPLFATTSEPLALIVGAVLITLLGVADDLLVIPPTVKLAGQIVASLGVALLGIHLVYFWVPGIEVIALSQDLALPLTIIALVAMVNAVNLIDGLDGLAAGIVAIAAIAFFVFTLASRPVGLTESVPTSAPLLAVIVAGMAVGFLVHNWHPASMYMGDTGSMLLGLLLGTAGVAYVGRTTAPSNVDFVGSIPLIVPALVLAIPFLDTAFAVVRRLVAGQPVTKGDRGHIHHLLLRFGHSHRRAVLVLYYWSALLAFGSVGPAFMSIGSLAPWLVGAVAVGIGLTAVGVGLRRPGARPRSTPESLDIPTEIPDTQSLRSRRPS